MRDQIRQEYGNIKARDLGTVLTQLSSTFVRHLPVKQQSAALWLLRINSISQLHPNPLIIQSAPRSPIVHFCDRRNEAKIIESCPKWGIVSATCTMVNTTLTAQGMAA
jgi:hypothetical protein